jgi:hypothetical protein
MQHLSNPSPDATEIEGLRAYALCNGAIMAVSGYFCPPGTYWADIIQPDYGTVATGRTPLDAARAAIRQFDRDQERHRTAA